MKKHLKTVMTLFISQIAVQIYVLLDKTMLGINFWGLFVIASSFSHWFYSQGFDGIQNLIKVGAIIIIPISISNVLGMQIMMPIGREKQFTISVICGLIVNFILNLIMIPLYGSMGSMIASVFLEFVITRVQLYFLGYS